jgi:hypothetical protein
MALRFGCFPRFRRRETESGDLDAPAERGHVDRRAGVRRGPHDEGAVEGHLDGVQIGLGDGGRWFVPGQHVVQGDPNLAWVDGVEPTGNVVGEVEVGLSAFVRAEEQETVPVERGEGRQHGRVVARRAPDLVRVGGGRLVQEKHRRAAGLEGGEPFAQPVVRVTQHH